MKLFKWKLSDLKPKFPSFVENFFGKKITDEAHDTENVAVVPSVNISDEEKAFEVKAVVPGFDKKDIKIEVTNGCLTISSEKQYTNEEKNKNWMRREFGYASFQRVFQLPPNADEEKVQAELRDGILTVKLGKLPSSSSKGRVININ